MSIRDSLEVVGGILLCLGIVLVWIPFLMAEHGISRLLGRKSFVEQLEEDDEGCIDASITYDREPSIFHEGEVKP